MTVLTQEQVKQMFLSLSEADQDALRAGLDTELREQNIFLQKRLDVLFNAFLTLRPVLDAKHKGRVTCIVCKSEGKKKEFRHLSGCLWAEMQRWKRQAEMER